jgi:competence protein ComEA
MKGRVLVLVGLLALVLVGSLPGVVANAGAQEAQVAQEERLQVDLNRASAADLEKVPGIGPATAARIVEWRETHGPFERVEDLLNVRGIGAKSLEKLKPYLTVEPKTSGPASRID